MNATYTPRPWRRENHNCIAGLDGTVICEVWGANSNNEALWNEVLIESAPDLHAFISSIAGDHNGHFDQQLIKSTAIELMGKLNEKHQIAISERLKFQE